MSLPDPEGFRVYAHEICNDTNCVKRFLLHNRPFSLLPPQTKDVKKLKDSFELF
jgi:hypothetical protein